MHSREIYQAGVSQGGCCMPASREQCWHVRLRPTGSPQHAERQVPLFSPSYKQGERKCPPTPVAEKRPGQDLSPTQRSFTLPRTGRALTKYIFAHHRFTVCWPACGFLFAVGPVHLTSSRPGLTFSPVQMLVQVPPAGSVQVFPPRPRSPLRMCWSFTPSYEANLH